MSKGHRLLIDVNALQMQKTQQQNNITAIHICDQVCKNWEYLHIKCLIFLILTDHNLTSDKDMLLTVYTKLMNYISEGSVSPINGVWPSFPNSTALGSHENFLGYTWHQ